MCSQICHDASEKYIVKKIMVNGISKLALVARQNIRSNMELRYGCCLENGDALQITRRAICGNFVKFRSRVRGHPNICTACSSFSSYTDA